MSKSKRKVYMPKHLKASYLPKIQVKESYQEPLRSTYKIKALFIGLFVIAVSTSIIDTEGKNK